MEGNRTLLEDVAETPSTSNFFIETVEDPFPRPADPFAPNVLFESENSTSFFNVTALKDFIDYVEENRWPIYVLVIIGTLIVVSIVLCILQWIFKNKKRVIRQEEDPVLSSTYNQEVPWRRICCNCCKSESRKGEEQLRARQNSASNLDPYRRQPLPPIGARPGISAFSQSPLDDSAIHIDGIRGVPSAVLRPEHYRKLPPLNLQN
ncbi:unnamed protein product [Caenorhabditis auriculariae]|uniref:Uncharacterized protein n=1 Tax=Caenorhabditis auriculariae TaxID=2777116 RepID=A0A8S1HDF9_9PELO|nr:unnamed protein product [Caenorhabditis auriculariae]